MSFASRKQDITRTGSNSYTPAQYELIVSMMKAKHVGAGQLIRNADLADRTGVAGREIREIFADADGVELLLGGGAGDGHYIAEWREQAEKKTREMESAARRMLERVARRRLMEGSIPYRQEGLW